MKAPVVLAGTNTLVTMVKFTESNMKPESKDLFQKYEYVLSFNLFFFLISTRKTIKRFVLYLQGDHIHKSIQNHLNRLKERNLI